MRHGPQQEPRQRRMTWAKPKFGLGMHFRGPEHVIFAGSLSTRTDGVSTLFEAPVGAHSEKPEKFYEIVRAASYPPYGEAFQRKVTFLQRGAVP